MNRNRNRNRNKNSAAIGSNNNNVKKNSKDGRDGDDNYAKDGYTINVDNEGHANGDHDNKDKMNKKDTDINHHHQVLDDVNHSNNDDDDSNEKNDTAASASAVVVDYDKLRELYFSKFQTIFRVHGGAMMKIKTGG
jgi:hypothetical protein